MGPPLITWPYIHPTTNKNLSEDITMNVISRKCFLIQTIDNFRVMCINFTYALLIFHIILSLSSVTAGPVVFNLDYMQGPVPLARNIRHLPCISRKTGQEGLCMFAIDCLKANGSHLGTCIDRFYFGSCCQIPDKNVLPQIIGNTIEDNSIDTANFVHPQTHDKFHINLYKKTTTEKIGTTTVKPVVTESLELETKSDDLTTIDNKIINEEVKLTTAVIIETTTKTEPKTTVIVTEVPIKLSTFQTVSGVSNVVTETSKETTESATVTIETAKLPEETTPKTTTEKPTKPSRKPIRPTFTRPTYKPSNSRPSYSQSTATPKPTKPVVTKRPPFRPPFKRPTKKPLPSPPRLNITILPQSTSSKPIFTKPSSVSIIYINTTNVNQEEIDTTFTTTTSTTTSPMTTTTSTTTSPMTTTSPTTTTSSTTEAPTNEKVTESQIVTETTITFTETDTERVTELPNIETSSNTQKEIATEGIEKVTEQINLSSATPTTTSTEFPALVTWTNTVDVTSKEPEKTTESIEETWSPITPPEGWVLITTPPKPETTITLISTTTASTTTTTTTEQTTTITQQPPRETTIQTITEKPTTSSTTQTTTITTEPTVIQQTSTEKQSSVTPTTSTTQVTTEAQNTTDQTPIIEFTVNVTLSPTMPTTTSSSVEQTTASSVTTENVTESINQSNTTISSTTSNDVNTTSGITETTTSSVETTTEFVNMSDYKNVCGRRLWHAPQGRIVGGAKSGFGQWPWQISLRQYRTSTYLHKCGAALLNENWAITAAHCVEHVPPSELLLRLGEHDLANEDEPYGFVERRVQIIASHPHFDPATFEYDLALLRFYEPVTFQPNILPICVPDDDADYVGKTAHVTGWGRLFDEGPLPSVLQEVEVPVINNSECEAMYKAADYNEHIPYIFICAGQSKGGADSCEGDSGGPMVIRRERDNRFVLSGIISWGIGCAEPNQPGVYTRISEFRDWINQILLF